MEMSWVGLKSIKECTNQLKYQSRPEQALVYVLFVRKNSTSLNSSLNWPAYTTLLSLFLGVLSLG